MDTRVRAAGLLAVSLAFPASAFASPDAPPQKGIELSDMDRSVEACTDFFEFANGAWRAANPIPPSMSRWSRRWKAGEDAKETAEGDPRGDRRERKDPPKGSVDQLDRRLLRGLHGRERAQRRRRQAPPAATSPRSSAMKTPADVGRMIGRFHAIGIPVPFGVTGGSDNHEPNDVIAQVYASGLGLPDRDYYLKPEARFVEARAKYLEHVARDRSCSPAGARPGRRPRRRDGLRAREGARRGVARQRRAARPDGHGPQDDVRGAPEADAGLRLGGLRPRAPASRRGDLNVNEPKFMAEVNRELASTPVAGLEDLPEVAAPGFGRRRRFPTPSCRRTSSSTGRTSAARRR